MSHKYSSQIQTFYKKTSMILNENSNKIIEIEHVSSGGPAK
jgi:hypothetical protein